jgi:hypothetical protein
MEKEKVQMPDGKGGYTTVEAERFSGGTADRDKQNQKLKEEAKKAHEERVGHAAEAFNGYHKLYASDHELSAEEVVKAVYLELLNLKEFYPEEMGGQKRVDELCAETYEWFNAQIR